MRHVVWIVLVAACHTSSSPPAPIGNRSPSGGPGCPAVTSPFEPAEVATRDDECTHGEPAPWFVGPGDPPACHVYTPTGPTSADEAITLADGRRIWMRQGGCVHATFELRAVPRAGFDRADRGAVIRAGASILDDAAAVAPEVGLANDAAAIVTEAAHAPTGSFPIGAGDNIVTVELLEGTEMISVVVDFPL